MIGIERVNIRGGAIDPLLKSRHQCLLVVAHARARLIGKFPGHDSRVVAITLSGKRIRAAKEHRDVLAIPFLRCFTPIELG